MEPKKRNENEIQKTLTLTILCVRFFVRQPFMKQTRRIKREKTHTHARRPSIYNSVDKNNNVYKMKKKQNIFKAKDNNFFFTILKYDDDYNNEKTMVK